MSEPQCEECCVECGDDIGTHHLCLDCIEAAFKGKESAT